MAQNDIYVFMSPAGGANHRKWAEMGGSQSFVRGEPVGYEDGTGQLAECPTDGSNPAAGELAGIADGPASYSRNGTTVTTNPKTGTNYAQGDLVPYVRPFPGLFFATENFTTNGSAFNNAAPTQAMIEDQAGLVHISGSWGLEHGTLDHASCRIVDVFEKGGVSRLQGGTAPTFTPSTDGNGNYVVVFEIVSHMDQPTAGAAPSA